MRMTTDQASERSNAAPRRALTPRQPVDLDAMLASATGEHFSFCRGKLLFCAPEDRWIIAGCDLLDGAVLSRIVDRYAQKYPGADRRAILSMWTMYYFSQLTIAAAVHALVLRRKLPLALDDIALIADPATGEPQAFLLAHSGSEEWGAPIHDLMQDAIRNHAEPLVAALALHGKVAKKLLWNNVVAYLAWIIKEIGHRVDPALATEGLAIVEEPVWPDGWHNPMQGMIVTGRVQCGLEFARRRVCCLRYALPGVAGCGEACPLPDGRA